MDHTHQFERTCIECLKNILAERDKLYRFVNEIADWDISTNHVTTFDHMVLRARNLISDIKIL